MSGRIRPSRVSTIFTLVKTSVWDDGSTFDCAQMHWLKQKKASKNTRIPQPLERAEKTVGEAYDRAPTQTTNFAACVFSRRCMNRNLRSAWAIPARSHPH